MDSEISKNTSIDIMVPTHGHLELTIRCIDAIYNFTKSPFHLIIVDDSTDLTPLYIRGLQKEHDNITYLHSDVPYKSGNQFFNIALENCKTPYLATVMNSMTVEPDWETVAIQLMQGDPKVGVIGFKCLFPTGQIESAGIAMNGYTPVDIGNHFAGHRQTLVYECLAVQWAFALLRVEAVKGILDEDLFHGFKGWDDIDNCFVVRSRGWKVLYDGMGAGYHLPRTTRGDNTEDGAIKNRENAEMFYKRWDFWEQFKQVNPGYKEMVTKNVMPAQSTSVKEAMKILEDKSK